MEGDLAVTYTLIYKFLQKHSHIEAANEVKKAAKACVVIKDSIEKDGPQLDEIVKEWKEGTRPCSRRHFTRADRRRLLRKFDRFIGSLDSEESSDESSENSDSEPLADAVSKESPDDDSSSEDETSGSDSDCDGDDNEETKHKSPKSSVTLSSGSIIIDPCLRSFLLKAGITAADTNRKPTKTPAKRERPTPEPLHSLSSDSELTSELSSSSSDEDESEARMSTSADTSSSSSSELSSSESDDEVDKANIPSTKAIAPLVPSKQDDTLRAAQKRKISEHGAAVATSVVNDRDETTVQQKSPKQTNNGRQRFQRVKAQNTAPELHVDNGYEAKTRADNDYGERAHRDLVVTRGVAFKKEKNKKKRGSYRGGEITLENHSIRFDD